ncbi:MAG TPA: FtsX-like permease family protein [Nitrospiraceae bacterium]|nr:FtsX-like permease family protein [Nitrospiraceae bacterium]
MKFKAFYLLGMAHLRGRPVRTAITVCGIALGVAVSIAIQTANIDVLRSFQETVLAIAGQATLEVSGGELGLDERVITDLRNHPSVRSATPVIQQGARVTAGPHRNELLLVVGVDLLDAADLKGIRLLTIEEEPSLDELTAPNAIFIGTGLASDWGLQVGDPLDLLVGTRPYRLTVRGIVESQAGSPSAWERMAVMDIAAAQALFNLVGRLDRIDLVTDPSRPVSELIEELQAGLPPSLIVSRPARRTEQVERMVRAFQLNLTTLSAVGLLVGLLLVYNTVSFVVVNRRREIGILRALGMSRGNVVAFFMAQAAVMGLIGGLAGTGLGILLARGLVSFLSRTVSDLYVPVAAVSGQMTVPAGMWLQGITVGVGISILGALVPSLEASRTAPSRALAPGDYEGAQELRTGPLAWIGGGGLLAACLLALPDSVKGVPVFGYLSAFCLLLSLSCLSPLLIRAFSRLFECRWFGALRGIGALGRVAAGQVARAPGRSAVTISALMVGIAIMVGVGTMIFSFRRTVDHWINQTIMADLIVAPSSWLQGEESGMLAKRIPLSWAEIVASVPGVAAVDPYRQLRTEVRGRPMVLVARDLRLHAQRSRYLFISGDAAETLNRTASAHGIVVSEVLARTLGVGPGETLGLMTPVGEHSFRIEGVFYDYATDGGKVVMDRSIYNQFWGDHTATVLAVYLDPARDAGEIRRHIGARLSEVAEHDGTLAIIRNADLKEEILAVFDRTFRVTYALEFIAVLIALLGIVNTLLTSVLERQGEIAILRAVGASRRQIGRLVLWEAAYLGLLGALLGLAGGLLLSVLLIEVINKQSFGWTIQFALPAGLLIQAVGLALAAALLAGYAPARWAAAQPVNDGLRDE